MKDYPSEKAIDDWFEHFLPSASNDFFNKSRIASRINSPSSNKSLRSGASGSRSASKIASMNLGIDPSV